MPLIYLLDFAAIALLVGVAFYKGVEQALPFLAFFMVLIPNESKIPLPGLFDLTTQRLVLVTVAALYFLLGERNAQAGRTARTSLKYLIAAHIGWSLISTANSVVFDISFKRLLSQVLEYYLLYYVLTRAVSQVRTIHKILFAIVAAIGVCGIFAYLEAYHSWSVLSLFPEEFSAYGTEPMVEFGRGLRVRATFPHPILFGGAIAITIPLALYLQTIFLSRLQRILLWLAILLMFLSLYKTGSRGPWIALTLSLGVLFLVWQNRARAYLALLGILAFSVLVMRPGVSATIQDTYAATLDDTTPMGASYEYRFALLDVAKQALARSPARETWGYGMGSFRSLGLEARFRRGTYPFLSCDSAWIELMVETGYVGLLLIAALLLRAAQITLVNFLRLPKPDAYLLLVLFIDMVAFYFAMMSVSTYSWGQNGHMLWMLIAMSMAYIGLKRRNMEATIFLESQAARKSASATLTAAN